MTGIRSDIIIIGAGAAGLIVARTLVIAGYSVIVLEARNRCGGRIYTINKEPFFSHAELGAEFVHGDLPVTLDLVNEAGLRYHPAGGEMWHFRNGRFSREDTMSKHWGLLMKRLNAVKEDISIATFLATYFPGDEYAELRNSVVRFASGYDTADPEKASTFALRQEWQNEDEGAQHRIEGGYGAVIRYLENEFKNNGGKIQVNTIAKTINWHRGDVEVVTSNGGFYQAKKLIIALPLGVLQSEDNTASIKFNPPLPEQSVVFKAMGFGAIIKILLQFDEIFWAHANGAHLKDMSFILSDEVIPTWWTQAPHKNSVLTGWLGGPKAAALKESSNNDLLDLSLKSLSNIFKIGIEDLKGKLLAFEVVNWTADPFTMGSYAYDTVGVSAFRKLLNEPVDDTIYFAGEYLYEGPAMGTVEAALTSGLSAAKQIVDSGN